MEYKYKITLAKEAYEIQEIRIELFNELGRMAASLAEDITKDREQAIESFHMVRFDDIAELKEKANKLSNEIAACEAILSGEFSEK